MNNVLGSGPRGRAVTAAARWRSPTGLGILAVAIAVLIWAAAQIYFRAASANFRFLDDHAGWDIPFSFLPYATGDPYWYVFLVGLTNTIGTGAVAIVAATIVGFVISIGRLSGNQLLGDLCRTYVDIVRNIPLILQAAFWYAVLLHLPPIRAGYNLFDSVLLSNRGLLLPKFAGTGLVAACVALALVAVWCAVRGIRYRRQYGEQDKRRPIVYGSAALVAAATVIALAALNPGAFAPDWPVRAGLNYQGGMRLPPEFVALLVAITVYRGAFIAEVFRGGLQSVPHGQIDAARSLGLRPWMTLLKIRLPLALISIVPALTSEYIVIMKVTSIGIVVGFWDLFAVSSNAAMMTGQTLEVLFVMVAIYIVLNYAIVAVMNVANNRMQLPGNEP